MAKFNKAGTTVKQGDTFNLAGGTAFTESPELELVSLLLTSFVEDKFYESAKMQLERLQNLTKVMPDKKFLAQAAIYARNTFGMRSITHALVGNLVAEVKGVDWLRKAIYKSIFRVDDITEILAFYLENFGKPIPNSLKRGIADAMHKFDPYQLAKYKGSKKAVKLVDVFNLVHPTPLIPAEVKAWQALIKGELKSTETWEAKLTQAGQSANTKEEKAQLKEQAWRELILERKIGYFALLRNLRNIVEQGDATTIDAACRMLVDERLITSPKNLVMPFRYATAETALQNAESSIPTKVLNALHIALDTSLKNVPKLNGKTVIVLDESGSMEGKPWDIGTLFAAILVKTNNADLITFSDDARYRNISTVGTVMDITARIRVEFKCSGTALSSALELMDKRYDRIIILSDMQTWLENASYWFDRTYETVPVLFKKYKKMFGVNPIVYSFDLSGYGTLQFPEKDVYCIAGWNEAVFDIMKALETDKKAMINTIKAIEI